MGRRHSSASYNIIPQAALPPTPAPAPAVTSIRSLFPSFLSAKSMSSKPFSLPALPVGELFGGVSNTVRGLVLNDNWWVLLLIIFLFFPNISNKMFGGLFKD
ncbi:MAG: hypothetical protein ACYCYE_01960 [Clostridia bacterium]